jgi:hypothetical protein
VVERDKLVAALSDFARTLVVRYEIGDVLYALVDRATDLLDLSGAGVTLADDAGCER